ncbi:hypothetical protein CcaverHIS002_0700990 [Cutaneotrichosporon cavernicola]|uniref:Myb-like domain-containing protein n=1 Tax=Cutaneotrichosporon cavernicola TaxID=279322 RepID=A0AA48L9W7_9TREE|nr:uncharacterized protein CcaverHIS019_0701000 [Cutaneotrichosporon cavernicola]BEI86753.1 hypothetical protein CcaverHIS002_0700990 [Cutaneotrichosporon cavernicola]BEI94528.1 hypothetical protein CcaverHIS019_0701000 [Cutaneotrichosporon cavernicola]
MPKVTTEPRVIVKREVKNKGGDASESPKRDRKPKPWTPEEEARFANIIDKICSQNLWRECKDDPLLAGRRANGIQSHWKSIYKKAFK